MYASRVKVYWLQMSEMSKWIFFAILYGKVPDVIVYNWEHFLIMLCILYSHAIILSGIHCWCEDSSHLKRNKWHYILGSNMSDMAWEHRLKLSHILQSKMVEVFEVSLVWMRIPGNKMWLQRLLACLKLQRCGEISMLQSQ